MNIMARVITYCLKPGASHSDEYYRTVADFATSWITAAVPDLRDLVDGFRQYRLEQGMVDRSDAEYAFELLALGFGVTMIPDDMNVFVSGNSASYTGLLGVSCASTNWNGGWDAGAIGIPCQGLLLDYVGCKYHWDRNGTPTDTNLKKLREILGV